MNHIPHDDIVVRDIAGAIALVTCTNSSKTKALIKMGFVVGGCGFERAISDMDDRRAIVRQLILLDALFSDGRDWCPAALLEYFVEQNWVSLPYKTISWKSPESWVVTTRNRGEGKKSTDEL